jgi:hypothetical protein
VQNETWRTQPSGTHYKRASCTAPVEFTLTIFSWSQSLQHLTKNCLWCTPAWVFCKAHTPKIGNAECKMLRLHQSFICADRRFTKDAFNHEQSIDQADGCSVPIPSLSQPSGLCRNKDIYSNVDWWVVLENQMCDKCASQATSGPEILQYRRCGDAEERKRHKRCLRLHRCMFQWS